MFVNNELGIEWWLPPRTASRMTRLIITKVGFELVDGHHILGDGKSGRKIILNVRNPYSIVVSRYRQFYKKNISINYTYDWETFKDFVRMFKSWVTDTGSFQFYTYPEILSSANTEPYFRVRYENYFNDLMSFDFIRDNQHLFPDELERLHKGKDGWVENSLFDTSIPYHEHYDQETADIVWEMYNNIFLYDGYDRESWKTITI